MGPETVWGYILEKSTMTFAYDYTLETPTGKLTQRIVFDLEGETKSRIAMGLTMKLPTVNINTGYDLGTLGLISC